MKYYLYANSNLSFQLVVEKVRHRPVYLIIRAIGHSNPKNDLIDIRDLTFLKSNHKY